MVFNPNGNNCLNMKKITLLLLLTLSVLGLQAQTTYQLNYDSIRAGKTEGTGATSLYGKVYLKNVGLGVVGDSILTVLNGRIRKVPYTQITGLQDSLTKKANRTFDNVASGAIANIKLANSTISGISLGSNLANLSAGTGLSFTSYNGSTARTANADTAVLQTVLNFFPKGDTRYARIGATGTVTSVTGTANQISSTGGDTPVLSIPSTFIAPGSVRATTTIESGTTGTSGKLSLKRSSDGVVASTIEQVNDNKLTLTSSGGTKLFDINADRIDFNSSAANATYWFGQNRPTATEVLINGSNNNKLILQNNEVAQLTLNSNGGTITSASLGSSGDIIVGANNTGLIGKIAVGSGLSLSGGTLSATGGSAGTVTTAGGTAGKIAKFTSASNIENSTITESGSDISISGNTTAASFIKSGGTSAQFLKADGSVDGSTYLTSSTGVSSITGTSNQVIASASTGAVTLSLPQSIATSSTPQFTSLGLGTSPSYTLDATKSVSSNYVGHIHNINTTAGTSFGLFIKAGTNGSDYPLAINTADNLTSLLNLTGSGDVTIKNDIIAGGTNGLSSKSLLIGTDGTIANYRWQYSLSGNDEIFASRGFGTVKTTNYTTGATVYSGAISATNLSGTNTGDQNLAPYATLASPALTGNPTAPTQTAGDNSTKIATTAYVDGSISSVASSNTYTPTPSAGSNSVTITPRVHMYTIVGKIVTVYGAAVIDYTSDNTTTIFSITLPAGVGGGGFPNIYSATGSGVSIHTSNVERTVLIDAISSTSSVTISSTSPVTVGKQYEVKYSFMYKIN